jgi:hypothetical protein
MCVRVVSPQSGKSLCDWYLLKATWNGPQTAQRGLDYKILADAGASLAISSTGKQVSQLIGVHLQSFVRINIQMGQ